MYIGKERENGWTTQILTQDIEDLHKKTTTNKSIQKDTYIATKQKAKIYIDIKKTKIHTH